MFPLLSAWTSCWTNIWVAGDLTHHGAHMTLHYWSSRKLAWDYSCHYCDVIMASMASQITSLTIVYSTVYSNTDQRRHQKLRVTGLCARNSPVAGEIPAQMASNAENVSIWWRQHGASPFSKHIDSIHHNLLLKLSIASTTTKIYGSHPICIRTDKFFHVIPRCLLLLKSKRDFPQSQSYGPTFRTSACQYISSWYWQLDF